MENIYNKLVSKGYIRTNLQLDNCLIVHSVAGAGKSTLIRELLTEFSCYEAYTFGHPDPTNLTGIRIKGVEEYKENKGREVILDEYLGGKFEHKCVAKFVDPFQYPDFAPPSHFVNWESKRFGENTSKLLRSLNFTAYSNLQDKFEITGIYEGEPRGILVYFEDEVGQLLKNHNTECKRYCEIRGDTFEEVCVVTSSSVLRQEDRYKAYVCLTRHKTYLEIRTPDATFTSSRLL